MNSEKLLYKLIFDSGGELIANYNQLAEKLNVSITTVKNYKEKLLKEKLITCKCKVIENKKQLIFKIKKEI